VSSTICPELLDGPQGQETHYLPVLPVPPTADKEEKENFCEQLQAVLDETPRMDLKILVDDLTAKVGTENTDRKVTTYILI
jgi:hypothetical protein